MMPPTPPRPRGAKYASVGAVTCGAGCGAWGQSTPAYEDDEADQGKGSIVPHAPEGWGEIDAVTDDGQVLTLFVCSRACERRLVMKLSQPSLGKLD